MKYDKLIGATMAVMLASSSVMAAGYNDRVNGWIGAAKSNAKFAERVVSETREEMEMYMTPTYPLAVIFAAGLNVDPSLLDEMSNDSEDTVDTDGDGEDDS